MDFYKRRLMAHLFPYLLGDAAEFEALAKRYRSLYRASAPKGLRASIFVGRGAYGEYFGGQSQMPGGY